MSVSSRLVGFCGSRCLPASAAGLVSSVVSAVLASGASVAVGCAAGADAAVLSAAVALLPSLPPLPWPRLLVFAAFGSGGAGSWAGSAVAAVRSAAALGASLVSVRWFAGDAGPLLPRLRRRSLAWARAVAAAPRPGSGVVALVAGGRSASPGSWQSVGWALALGLPVLVFPVGCDSPAFPSAFPGLPPVSWVPAASSGLWSAAFRAVLPPALF